MADETPPDGKTGGAKKSPFKKMVLICGVTAVLSGAAGAAIPVLFRGSSGEEAAEGPQPTGVMSFVPFGDVTVNLNDGRLSRYLRVNIVLQVDKIDELSMTELVAQKQSMLKSWLLGHLAGKSMEDVRGTAGQNLLRREIHDHFNDVLSIDGTDRISDILFEEFNVQ